MHMECRAVEQAVALQRRFEVRGCDMGVIVALMWREEEGKVVRVRVRVRCKCLLGFWRCCRGVV